MADTTVADIARSRLFVLGSLVMAMVLALGGRLWYLQIATGSHYKKLATLNVTRQIFTPAVRGEIVDDRGQSLIENQTAEVITVDRSALQRLGKVKRQQVLDRLAQIVPKTADEIWHDVQICGTKLTDGSVIKQPCWLGGQFQPVPVATFDPSGLGADPANPRIKDPDIVKRKVLTIEENPDLYPGIAVSPQAVREYPQKFLNDTSLAAQTLGYLSPLTADDKKKPGYADLADSSQIGRAGLENQYDQQLRGQDGVQTVAVNSAGQVDRTVSETAPVDGNDLVLNLDANIQRGAEQALQNALKNYAPAVGKAPTEAAAVVMTTDGRVVALASAPSYDPAAFTGGISSKDYAALTDPNGTLPLTDRATEGLYQPGSTWKAFMTTGLLTDGQIAANPVQKCGPSYTVGEGKPGAQVFKNFEGESGGLIDFRQALTISCNTYFYPYAYDEWVRDGGLKANTDTKNVKSNEYLVKAAKSFGFGSKTGIDLPAESKGLAVDRAQQTRIWEQQKAYYCADAKKRSGDIKLFEQDFCNEGYRYRAGDAVQFVIGQGSLVLASPLQMARGYAAIANGGKLYTPTIAKALVSPTGQVVQTFTPKLDGTVVGGASAVNQVRDALYGVTHAKDGTADGIFGDYPIKVSGKTGTATKQIADKNGVTHEEDTSWFASFAPSDKPEYVVVVVVPNSEQGAHVAAPAAQDIYNVIFGVKNKVLNASSAAHRDGHPPTQLPCFNNVTGQISAPTAKCHAVPGAVVSPPPSTLSPSAGGTVSPAPPSTPSGSTSQRADAEPASRFRLGAAQ